MRRLFEICTCMALALTATSCVRDEVVVVPALPSPSDVIAFGANLPDEATRSAEGGKTLDFSTFDASSEDGSFSLPMAIKVEEGISKYVADTRGAVVDSRDKLTSLKAWARLWSAGVAPELYIPGTAFEKNTTTGIFFPTGGESYLWPGEGKTLDFVTVSPANIEGFEPVFDAADATRVTEFHYTVPADVADQPDILVATTSKSGNFGESVPLDFKHIMAAVNFKVGTINSTVDCTIQSITMKGVYDHGSYQITTGEWVDREVEGTNFSVPLPSGGLAITGSSTKGQPINNASTQAFMMIPQQPTTGAEIEIKLIAHNMGNKEYTLHASVQGHVWARNTTTNYLINIDGDYGLQIVAEDQLIDSHYVITKVRVSSEYPKWQLIATALDGADVSIQKEAEVNTLAKKGYWTDYEVRKSGNEYVSTGISARGSNMIDDGTAGNDQIVYVFIPENVSGEDRNIILTLIGEDNNGNTSYKTLSMVQNSVKWLDPTGEGIEDLYWGCELLIEGGQVGWGFCWDNARAEWRVLGKGNENNQPSGWVTKIRDAMEAAGLNVSDLEVEGSAIRVLKDKEHKSRWLIYIDYGLLGRIDVAHDPWLGDKNTEDLYLFQGVNAVNSILDFINSASNEVGHVDGTYNPSAEMTLDYAAMYAMKRNRFYYYEKDVEGTMMYTPVIDVSKDLNWYLPAKDQFPILMKSDWGQQFTFNDLYWTSTAYLEDETNNSLSYAYINGVETIAHRNDTYLTMALRRKTHTADVVVKPEDVVVPGAGDNGPEYGEGGNTDNNQGGDIEGNNL